MTNIEKYLIEHGFAEKERYPVGTVTYMTKDESGFYGGDEIVILPSHEYEILVGYPYHIVMDRLAPADGCERIYLDSVMAAFEDHLKWAIRLRDELNAVEDPWGEVE